MSTTKRFTTIELVTIPVFVALMAIGTNVTSFLVIGSVPITLQALIAILAGIILGSRLGALSMTVYLLVGLAGAPIFSKFSGGLSTFVSPTFGFLLSFILIAFTTGFMIEKAKEVNLRNVLIASYISLAITYLVGTHYMYYALIYIVEAPAPYGVVWGWMVPALIKDIIVTAIGATIALRVHKALKKKSPLVNQSKQIAS